MFGHTRVALMAAVLGSLAPAIASDLRLYGSIEGEVRNTEGIAQMGANVFLFNRLEQPVDRALTGPDGKFRFNTLRPDTYSVRVQLSTYVPASRQNVPVRAGMSSYLSIQLATIFSTIEFVYTAPLDTGIVSDEWKWVLRSANSTRPVLRLHEGYDVNVPGGTLARDRKVFSATRGLMRVSAGDSGMSSTLGNEPDLGTAFALATTLFGGSELRVAGNVGYATSTGAPTTGFRTRYARTSGAVTPDVEVTVRQMSMRHWVGMGLATGAPDSTPTLRTMSVKLQERQQITDEISLDYGVLLESVVFLDRMNLLSPFARLTYDLGEIGTIEAGYSSGAPALDLIAAGMPETGVQNDLLGLAMFPRVSLTGGDARVQQTSNYELGYRKIDGKRTYSAAVYSERVQNAAITMAAPAGVLPPADLMPDISSNSSIFNMGSYSALGYMLSALQDIGGGWTAGVAYGAGGALAPVAQGFETAADLRAALKTERRQWASARISGILPKTGTRIASAYVWTPDGGLAPAHAWLTQRWQPQMGLNIQVRQPLPSMGLTPGRWEMNADLRNLLASGYVPVAASDGRSVYLIQFPRSVRGGLSFIF